MHEEAKRLFLEYRNIVNQDFSEVSQIEQAGTACRAIRKRLNGLGYDILRQVSARKFRPPGFGKEIGVEFHFRLFLLFEPIFEQVDFLEAKSRVYPAAMEVGGEEAEEESGDDELDEALTPEDAEFLNSIGMRTREPQLGEWTFSPIERHVWQSAFARHPELIENEGPISWQATLEAVSAMAPADDDAKLFAAIITREFAFLAAIGFQTILECGCSAESHAQILEEWRTRNIL